MLVSVTVFFMFTSIIFAQQPAPSCEENLEVMKLVYATSRNNAELYLEQLARGKVQADQVKTKLDEAVKKIKELEETKASMEKPE